MSYFFETHHEGNPEMDFVKQFKHSRATLSDGFSNGAFDLLFEATLAGDQENFIIVLEKNPGVFEDVAVVSAETPLHIASTLGHNLIVTYMISRNPGFTRELIQADYSSLHLASSTGHVEAVKALMCIAKGLCFVKDNHGGTPLHCATMVGTLDVMKGLFGVWPASIMAVTARRDTAFHVVVMYNQCEAVQLVVDWPLQMNNLELINCKDLGGNTVPHLVNSKKQFQTLEILHSGNPTIMATLEVNSMNLGDFTALNILDVLPQGEDMEMEIENTLQRAGALNSRDITKPKKFRDNKDEVLINFKSDWKNTSHDLVKSSETLNKQSRGVYDVMLLSTAAVMATITFYAAVFPPGSTMKRVYKHEKQDIVPTCLFIFFNSTGFFTSVGMIIYLTSGFPMKLWLLVSMSSLLGSYSFLIMAISEDINFNGFFLLSPAVLLAVAWTFTVARFLGHKYLPWGCTRNLRIR